MPMKKAATRGNGEHTKIIARQLFLYALIFFNTDAASSFLFPRRILFLNTCCSCQAFMATATAMENGAMSANTPVSWKFNAKFFM